MTIRSAHTHRRLRPASSALLLLAAPLLLLASPPRAAAAPSATIGLQGRLVGTGGTGLSGVITIEFRLYDDATSGTKQWSETQDIALSDGFFAVTLGEFALFPAGLFRDHPDLWLEYRIGSSPLMPRRKLAGAPYALGADAADVSFDPSGTGLSATNVYDALNELYNMLDR